MNMYKKQEVMIMSLIEMIIDEMNHDDESDEKKEDRLISIYDDMTHEEQQIMNEIFITLTGWSFGTLKGRRI